MDLWIGMLAYGNIHPKAEASLLDLIGSGRLKAWRKETTRCCNIPVGRCQLVDRFLDTSARRMLMLDADVCYKPFHVTSLWQAMDELVSCHVIAGIYRKRNGSGQWTFAPEDGITPADTWKSPVKAKHAATGFMMIDRACFELVPWPWFELEAVPEERRWRTSDVSFCHKVARAGLGVWAHLGVRVGHLGEVEY